jgi:PTS system nitrogen regulatory IIA component
VNLNARAAARLLNVTEERVYAWAAEGVLPSHKVQDQLRFNRVELLEWAASRRMKVAPELFQDDRRAPGGNGFRLSRALEAGGIHRGVVAGDAREALAAIVARAALPAGLDRETAAALMTAREGVTPVGNGIAIPHARSPVVLPLADPVVSLTLLERPLDLGAPDRKPVGALFAIFSPTIRVHLDVLSKLAFALSDEPFLTALERRAPDVELLDRLRALEKSAAPRAANGDGGHAG